MPRVKTLRQLEEEVAEEQSSATPPAPAPATPSPTTAALQELETIAQQRAAVVEDVVEKAREELAPYVAKARRFYREILDLEKEYGTEAAAMTKFSYTQLIGKVPAEKIMRMVETADTLHRTLTSTGSFKGLYVIAEQVAHLDGRDLRLRVGEIKAHVDCFVDPPRMVVEDQLKDARAQLARILEMARSAQELPVGHAAPPPLFKNPKEPVPVVTAFDPLDA